MATTHSNFLRLLHINTASAAVGPSTARGMGPGGTIAAARAFLADLNLRQFEVSNERVFKRRLEACTHEFMSALPRGARYWGSARKFLNIFLRDIFYNRYFYSHYRLKPIEAWLEIPLDSHVAKGLKSETKKRTLPRWKTVIGLSPEVSDIYQEFAHKVAREKGTYRVHLDLLYWRNTSGRASHG